MYRFLREFCHYTGHNDMIEMQQFAEDDGGEARNDARGIYYDPAEKQWFINDDNARDWPVNLHDMETMTPEER
ncbi:MAG: hypothetical protein H6766_04320 [Candidatus Peribacteria bacterium]|nr:MAG: hypothetical protein H6766_04320 [Candidatus Peribacteria bacterium]